VNGENYIITRMVMKWILKKEEVADLDWIRLAQVWVLVRVCFGHGHKLSTSLIGGESLDQLCTQRF
jgi:hypothetical protein